jgi:hypothetical protein
MLEGMSFRENLLETVRKASGAGFETSILLASSSEIGLLRPVSSTFEASLRSLSGLFGQFLRESFVIGRRLSQHHYFTATSRGIEVKSPVPTLRGATFRTHLKFAKLSLRHLCLLYRTPPVTTLAQLL